MNQELKNKYLALGFGVALAATPLLLCLYYVNRNLKNISKIEKENFYLEENEKEEKK